MAKIFVKPKEGLRVLNPATKLPIPDEGMVVNSHLYWTRRQLDGDITISEKAFETMKKTKTRKNKSETSSSKQSLEVNNDSNI